MSPRVERGFSLLEAIVALTIFSSASVALYSWYGTIMIGLVRAEERLELTEFSRNVDAYLTTLNLQSESTGVYSANGYSAHWQAALLEPKQEGRNLGGQLGYYRLGLYELKIVIVEDSAGKELDTLVTRVAGYEGVRVPVIEVRR